MALTKFPLDPVVTAEAIAEANSTASIPNQADVTTLLINILTELRIQTLYILQGFDIGDDTKIYRDDPDNHLL